MRAMILAAGRGARMGDLTAAVPKPLLRVGHHYLIEYSIKALAKINIREIVINVAYLKEQICAALGDGSRYGVHLQYSEEAEALETGGGIFQALPLLGDQPFIVISSDIITNYPLENLFLHPKKLAHLVMVDNPVFHPMGDFGLQGNMIIRDDNAINLTFSNIGIYRPELFAECKPGKFRLAEVLKQAIARHEVTGEHYQGLWHNIGTPVQLAEFVAESY